jgi:hypothetical protein
MASAHTRIFSHFFGRIFSHFLVCVFSCFYPSHASFASQPLRSTTPPLILFDAPPKNLLERRLLPQTTQTSLGRASHCGTLPQEGLPIEGQLWSLIVCPYPYLNAIY